MQREREREIYYKELVHIIINVPEPPVLQAGKISKLETKESQCLVPDPV